MRKTILVAGATGDLGMRIIKALLAQKAPVKALVRQNTDPAKIKVLEDLGVSIAKVDLNDAAEVAANFADVSCVVSALAGLREVIIDLQLDILNAALSAGVPRFIPSDFATDFRGIPLKENRNFDLRKEFRLELDKSGIQATSIFNGAFAEILRYNMPLYDSKTKTITTFDGKDDWKVDFTAMNDTAAYTARVALDDTAPRDLRIAGFSLSPNDLLALSEKHKGERFELVNKGALEAFSAELKIWRASDPAGETNLYSKWQQAQYLHAMFFTHHEQNDNGRYPSLSWTSEASYL